MGWWFAIILLLKLFSEIIVTQRILPQINCKKDLQDYQWMEGRHLLTIIIQNVE